MACKLVQRGLRQYENEDILLLGGYHRAGSTPSGTIGAGFTAFDVRQLVAGVPADSAKLGTVELFLPQQQMQLFHGLVNIEVCASLRRQGIGRRIVQSIAATAPDRRLKIYDVQAAALRFWVQLGCTFQPRPPAWDAYFTLRTASAEEILAPPPGGIGTIPASRPRRGDRSPD